MTAGIIFSADFAPFSWDDAQSRKGIFGSKGALLATVPRLWTLPFALVPASLLDASAGASFAATIDKPTLQRLAGLSGITGAIIVRSSVIGESIWDRGQYTSIDFNLDPNHFSDQLDDAVRKVLASAPGKKVGLVIQSYVRAPARGEFGNLLRISKTRDHFELSTIRSDGSTSRTRFNTQRDPEASDAAELLIRPRERLFGSIAAWLNNRLLRGSPQRINCEWITDNRSVYLVQLDEEDEDISGINPYQLQIQPVHRPKAAKGIFLAYAEGNALHEWDKLRVLDELWEPKEKHKPALFYVPLAKLPQSNEPNGREQLENDFRALIGPNDIIVRTSVRAGKKLPNLPRTECLSPDHAAAWCLEQRDRLAAQGYDLTEFSFVIHRFMAAKASAWVRAEPGSSLVEINALWGLPDALQYFPYDIWEVHLPTETATDYPEYKPNMLCPRPNGGWEYVRVKNELARHLCISRAEAIDLAKRTAAIANRLGRACHVMWFVGCKDDDGTSFSVPWYWTEAHEAVRNPDRTNYNVITISDRNSLEAFRRQNGPRWRQALELKPTDLDLMRDNDFINAVGAAANEAGIPIILAGSTLAHAYYQLSRQDCTIVTTGEKEHSRVRRNAVFGKLVRDKIPERIANREEAGVTKRIPRQILKGFLIGKLLEEALEVRTANGREERIVELADLFEVVRALISAEGTSVEEVIIRADDKKNKAGGFEKGLVLLQTGILGRDKENLADLDRGLPQMARQISDDTYEIPFYFFGFMDVDVVRSAAFETLGVRLDIRLMPDRLELSLHRIAEQLELPL